MFKNIYQELVAIRTELQLIRNEMESVKKIWVGIDMCGEGEAGCSPINGEDGLENYLGTSMELSNTIKNYRKMNSLKHVDKTIEGICGRIQRMDMSPDRYADTVMALAYLVGARAL